MLEVINFTIGLFENNTISLIIIKLIILKIFNALSFWINRVKIKKS